MTTSFALVALLLLTGCSMATKLLEPEPSSPHTGLVVQNPTCFLFCFSTNKQYLNDTDITPYGKGKVIPEAYYP